MVKITFQNVQKVSLKHKKKYALIAVGSGVAAASLVGASPIPFSDCAILIPTEITMLASIVSIYGISVPKDFIVVFLASTIGCGTATLLGRFAVVTILKCIPGVGTLIGSLVSGATAGVITAALGGTFIIIIERIFKGELNPNSYKSEDFKRYIQEVFKNELKNKKK